MFRGLIENILVPVKNALEAAKLFPQDISKVILVGGSSRLPVVKETLEKFFGRDGVVCADADPDEAIARGAAMQSYRINNRQATTVHEITAYHYGLEIVDKQRPGHMRILDLIPRGKAVSGFHLDKFRIGQFVMSDLPPRKAGECQFDVTYSIDRNNILHAAAQGKGDISQYKKDIDIKLDNVV
ncbi:chaperone protein DnaK-like [Paramacrobiotus metropolitanus]|uniref:chaperone protein DnaK-like n=1 Tax=Paramacrobiotus metropolitanus TaxID=2943436 RepID=UPI002445DCDA|nr:chaperone protein DnaK-like [Paramacrobiotus metropolitanus]